ncbi:RNA polymerase II largest subunit [Mycena leptocephala]|nr:RNA polymerase II largest subunit [Mycena leptocephala]
MESPQPKRRLLSPSDVYTTFMKISDPDLELLGLSRQYARPEWMILTVLPVPPMTVRPSIATDREGTRKDDYLTLKLGDIIRASAEVRRCEQEGQPAHVIRESRNYSQFHVATYMDDDIPGIPRAPQNCSRPRVDFCARTVVTGDPNIELNEWVCLVTPYNIGYLQDFVGNGPAVYPGANYVVCDTGERIDLRYSKSANELIQYGWIVERHLKDGDFLLLNRQPSLSKTSMMAHRVKVMPTRPQLHNANFDGDEMNMQQIISPATNKPILGLVQDSLFGVYKFTLRDTFLDWNQVQNILLWVPEWNGVVPMPAIVIPKPLWTGKQILGLNGEILFGAVDKKTVSSLIEVVFREKGAEATMRFISGVQKVVGFWLFHSGFSLGRPESHSSILFRASSITHGPILSHTAKELEEGQQYEANAYGRFCGSSINVAQITACVGQQSVDVVASHDFSPEARGFVESTYMRGLNASGVFLPFHGWREDLVNAEVKRADIGHIRVRLIKALEDVMVCYDDTARNSRGDVIQLVYGEDGMDTQLPLDVMDEKNGSGGGVLLQSYPNGELPRLQTKLDEEFKKLAEDRELLRTLIFQRDVSSSFIYLPVNLQRVPARSVYILDAVKALGERLIIVRGDDSISKQAQEDACCVFRMHLRATLAARQVVDKYASVARRSIGRWARWSQIQPAIVNPAEMCGILAAQSIAETVLR